MQTAVNTDFTLSSLAYNHNNYEVYEIDGTGKAVELVCYNKQEKTKSSSSSSLAKIKVPVLPD